MDANILKKLNLDGLVEVHSNEIGKNQKAIFLGVGQILVDYNCEIKQQDSYAAKLAGADEDCVVPTTVKGANLDMPIPEESTHFALGPVAYTDERYRSTGKCYAYEKIPIVFLRALE